jgi:nucleotide-binding universal stress UspA family protein
MKIRSILCPTDFSAFAGRALDHAVMLARWYGAELTLAHVYPFMAVMGGDALYFPSGLPLDASMRERLTSELESAAGPARAAGVKVTSMLLEGDPAEELLQHARTTPTDLIVMGTHGRRGFDRWVLGSVAGRIVHRARCAVLTVPRPPEVTGPAELRPYEKILCPIELAGLLPILDTALSIAAASKARLTVFHVVEDVSRHEATARMAGVPWGDFLERLENDARHELRRAVQSQGGAGDTVDELVVTGKPYREILRAAEERGVGLIVMGIHGRNALERMFVGSTALHVLRQSPCPVLTVRAPDERAQR